MRITFFLEATVASALVFAVGDVVAGPCGFGALCGRPSCDATVMTQYKQALPAIKACEASINWSTFWSAKTADEFIAQCFNAPCGAALADIARFADVEATTCELHYPTRETSLLSGEFVSNCIQSSLPQVKAEADKRLGRGLAPPAITTTPAPTVGSTSAPRTSTPSPSPVPTVVLMTAVPTATPPPTTPPPTPAAVTSLPTTSAAVSSPPASSASSASHSSADDTNSVETISAPAPPAPTAVSRRPSLAPSPSSSSPDLVSGRTRNYAAAIIAAMAWLQV
ncbi:hypothetical protein PINS_up019304 [Pythium insidiosum]|nr:hypothetical protein PINS_up019304 [Pythium insidiosum]